MRPPFTYYGGKTGMAQRVVELLPEHRVYLEPFAGSLAVLFAKAPAVYEVVNDLDDTIVTFFRVLRERTDDLAQACALSPYSRVEFAVADLDDTSVDELERARRFWVRVNQSFAKTTGHATGWSRTRGGADGGSSEAVVGPPGGWRNLGPAAASADPQAGRSRNRPMDSLR